jgi:4'-phosphopantetheinyl transferase
MVGEWLLIDELPSLGDEEVQIWRIDLPSADMSPTGYICLLSEEEQARAERLRAGLVRLQFVVARAALRVLLGNCLALDPTAVSITQTSFGKPETPEVFYNVAHSGAAILIALCRAHRVGIDVEYFSRQVDALEIAKNSFAESEVRALSAIRDVEELRRAFFRCWTRKEAVIKADGRGLSLPLDAFEVPVGEMTPSSRIIISVSRETQIEPFYVSDLPCGDEVAAAFATAGPHSGWHGFLLPLNLLTQKA